MSRNEVLVFLDTCNTCPGERRTLTNKCGEGASGYWPGEQLRGIAGNWLIVHNSTVAIGRKTVTVRTDHSNLTELLSF